MNYEDSESFLPSLVEMSKKKEKKKLRQKQIYLS